MEPFEILLSNNASVTGIASLPSRDKVDRPSTLPLILALHGGTYSANYFFADDQHSAVPLSSALGIPFLAINRPSYRDSTPLPTVPEHSSYLQEEGKYLHNEIIPAIWKRYASQLGVSSIVLLTHSNGTPGGIVAAALNAKGGSYPLAGLIISGHGTEWNHDHVAGILEALKEEPATIDIPDDIKDVMMLGTIEEGKANPSIYKQTAALQNTMGFAEVSEVLTQWLSYWHEHAAEVTVPVMYALAGEDFVLTVSEQHVRDFAAAFTKSPRVESGIVLGAPHCIELSRFGQGWYARAFGFALECAVARDLEKGF